MGSCQAGSKSAKWAVRRGILLIQIDLLSLKRRKVWSLRSLQLLSFIHKNREKLSHTYREVRRLCEEQKIEDFVFHDLRHCTVTNLADAGVDTETIMKIVGHSSVEMFLRYRTINPETLDAAMTRLNTLITRHENAARQVPGIAAL